MRIPTAPVDTVPWEQAIERDDLARAEWLAILVQDRTDLPDWLRDMADDVADRLGFWTSWGGGAGPSPLIRMVPALMHLEYAYQELTEEFLANLPDEVKAACPAEVELVKVAAKLSDNQGFSRDCRLECLQTLNKLMTRLKSHADFAGRDIADEVTGIDIFDSDPLQDADGDEHDDDSDDFERGYNYAETHEGN